MEQFSNTEVGADVIGREFSSQINRQDLRGIIEAQQQMLARFDKTNEVLTNLNHLSEKRFSVTAANFRQHQQMLGELKEDLQSIFIRIRGMKNRLKSENPAAFAAASAKVLGQDGGGMGRLSEDVEEAEAPFEDNVDIPVPKTLEKEAQETHKDPDNS